VALAALASALLLLASIVLLRTLRRWRAWRLAAQEGRWREAMHLALEDPAAARLPVVGALELPAFAVLFNHLQESLKGEAADNLAKLLRNHQFNDRMLAMLGRRSLRLRLVAITALGHLREERAWEALVALSKDPGPVLSFAAARALLRIDARQALELLTPALVQRGDWSLARIGSIFQELGPAVVTPPLVNMLVSRPREGLERVVKLARFGHRHRVAPIVRGWLSASDEPEVIVAALNYVEDAEDLRWAKGAARHAEWTVRMAAAKALGRIGQREELVTLLALLRDPVWWVRYHAAQSLTHLHGLQDHEVEALRQDARDAYASDMLAQAMAQALAERARTA
jgi:HEAT repeat protein